MASAIWRSLFGVNRDAGGSQGHSGMPVGLPMLNKQLDISEVFSRVFIVGMPYSGPTSRESHRNNVDDLARYLDETYGRHNYCVWNLTSEERCTVDATKFHQQVLRFPPLLAEEARDSGLPTVAEIFAISYSIKFWLDQSPEHVAILHDTNGRTRAPFVVACYLAWEHAALFPDSVTALQRAFFARCPDWNPAFPRTWWRTLLNFDAICNTDFPVPARSLTLVALSLYMPGPIREHRGDILVQVFEGKQLVWDSDNDRGEGADDYRWDDGCLKVVMNSVVRGDVQIHVSAEVAMKRDPHIVPTPLGELPDMSALEGFVEERIERRLLLRYAFHTNVMPPDVILVPLNHVDVLRSRDVLDLRHLHADRERERAAQSGSGGGGGPPSATTHGSATGVDEDDYASRDSFWMQMVLGDSTGATTGATNSGAVDSESGSAGGSTTTAAAAAGPALSLAAVSAAESSASAAARVSHHEAMCDVRSFDRYANWLNLRGRAAQLAGLFHFGDTHCIFPEAEPLMKLRAEFKLPQTLFAIVALQQAERDLSGAREILRSEFLAHLIDPKAILPSTQHHGPKGLRRGSASSTGSGSGRGRGATDASGAGGGAGAGGSSGLFSPGLNSVAGDIHHPDASDTVIPVIATTLARMLAVQATPDKRSTATATGAAAAARGDGTAAAAAGDDLIGAHEKIVTFLRDGLHRMLDDDDEDEQEVEQQAGASKATAAQTAEGECGAAASASQHVGSSGSSTGGSSSRRPSTSAPAASSSTSSSAAASSSASSLLSPGPPARRPSSTAASSSSSAPSASVLSPPAATAGTATATATATASFSSPSGGMGPSTSSLLGLRNAAFLTPGKSKSLAPVFQEIAASPNPPLYLAALQLAAAVRTAERKHGNGSGSGAADATAGTPGAPAATASTSASVTGGGGKAVDEFHSSVQHLDPFVVQQLLTALQQLNASASLSPGGSPGTSASGGAANNNGGTGASAAPSNSAATSTGGAVSAITSAPAWLLGSLTSGLTGVVSSVAATVGLDSVLPLSAAAAGNGGGSGSGSGSGAASVSSTRAVASSLTSPPGGGYFGGKRPAPGSGDKDKAKDTDRDRARPSLQEADAEDLAEVRRARAVQELAKVLASDPSLGKLFELLSAELHGYGVAQTPLREATAGGRHIAASAQDPEVVQGVFKQSLEAFLQKRAGADGAAGPDGQSAPTAAATPGPTAAAAEGAGGGGGEQKPTTTEAGDATGFDTTKYERMLKMGVPAQAVRLKMSTEGAPAAAIDKVCGAEAGGRGGLLPLPRPKIVLPTSPPLRAPGASPAGSTANDSEPPSTKVANAAAAAEARAARVKLLRDEQQSRAEEARAPLAESLLYGQYFKQLKVGIAVDVVKQKMAAAGLDPTVLDLDAKAPHPTPFAAGSPYVALRDDATYSKYFRMLKFGLPSETVAHKLTGDGMDAVVLELDPELPVPPSLTALQVRGGPGSSAAGSDAGSEASSTHGAMKRRLRKRLHWELLPSDRVRHGDTIWALTGRGSRSSRGGGEGDGEDDEDEEDDDLFDDEEFEQLFTADPTVVKVKSAGGAGGGGQQGGAGGKTVSLLDLKRSRQCGIGLGKLRLPADTIRACLLQLSYTTPDGHALSYDNLLVLEELLPTPEEVTLVKSWKGDKARLGEAERFFLAVADVPKAKARAQALAYQRHFDVRVSEMEARVGMLERACSEVKGSLRLRKVLEATLKLGARLNADDAAPTPSSGKGGKKAAVVHGITLNSLLKLGQTKAFNGRTTVLHYLVSLLQRKDADCLALAEDMPSCAPASRMDVRVLKEDAANIKKDLANVERLVREQARANAFTGSSVLAGQGAPPPALAAASALASAAAAAAAARSAKSAARTPAPVAAPADGGDGPPAATPAADGEGTSTAAAAATPGGQQTEQAAADSSLAPVAEAGAAVEVEQEHEQEKKAEEPAGPEPLLAFVPRAQTVTTNLSVRVDAAAAAFAALLSWFGEDENMSCETFFATLHQFVRSIQRARTENADEEAKAARIARAAAAAAASSASASASASAGSGATTGTSSPSAAATAGGAAPGTASATATATAAAAAAATATATADDEENPRKRLEALFKAKSDFFVRTGGPQSGAASAAAAAAHKHARTADAATLQVGAGASAGGSGAGNNSHVTTTAPSDSSSGGAGSDSVAAPATATTATNGRKQHKQKQQHKHPLSAPIALQSTDATLPIKASTDGSVSEAPATAMSAVDGAEAAEAPATAAVPAPSRAAPAIAALFAARAAESAGGDGDRGSLLSAIRTRKGAAPQEDA